MFRSECKHEAEIESLHKRVMKLEANYSPAKFVAELMGQLSEREQFGMVNSYFFRRLVETINEMQLKRD